MQDLVLCLVYLGKLHGKHWELKISLLTDCSPVRLSPRITGFYIFSQSRSKHCVRFLRLSRTECSHQCLRAGSTSELPCWEPCRENSLRTAAGKALGRRGRRWAGGEGWQGNALRRRWLSRRLRLPRHGGICNPISLLGRKLKGYTPCSSPAAAVPGTWQLMAFVRAPGAFLRAREAGVQLRTTGDGKESTGAWER